MTPEKKAAAATLAISWPFISRTVCNGPPTSPPALATPVPINTCEKTMVRLGDSSTNPSSPQRQILRPTNLLLLFLLSIALLTFLGTKSQEAKKQAAASNNLRGGASPLVDAIRAQNVDKVKELIKNEGKDVNEEDEKGITPLIEATLTGNESLVKLIMEAGAPAQPPAGFRHTPLRAACLTGNVNLIELLLREGADPNAKSEGDRTPLMGACFLRPGYSEERSLPAVQAMLKDGRTDVTIANAFGETAISLCKERGYNDSVKVLEDAAAKVGAGGRAPKDEKENEVEEKRRLIGNLAIGA